MYVTSHWINLVFRRPSCLILKLIITSCHPETVQGTWCKNHKWMSPRWFNIWPSWQMLGLHWTRLLPQQARDIQPRLVQCWPSVYDAGPTLNQPWLNVSCFVDDAWVSLSGPGPALLSARTTWDSALYPFCTTRSTSQLTSHADPMLVWWEKTEHRIKDSCFSCRTCAVLRESNTGIIQMHTPDDSTSVFHL